MLAWIKVALRWNIVVLVILHVVIITEKSRGDHVKVCTFETPITIGTRREGDQVTSRCQRCEDLRNCSTVVGSVHLKGIYLNNNKELKRQIRFPNLKEITGSLIVTFLGDVPSLSDILPNLAVIHGHVSELFKDFSLVVYLNDGLEVLGMNSLTVVRQGGIMIGSNQKLCYLDRIRWKSLMNNGLNEGRYELSISGNSNDCFEKCLGCRTPSGHGSSGIAYCWGGERDNCQKLCHSNCGSHGCISGTQEECCHAQCLGGCSQAGSPFHCNGCQHLRLQSGECVEKCPAGLKEVNEFTCEPNCSKPLLDYNGKCVNDCPAGYTANRTVCSRCPTNSCPRVCTQSVFNPTIKINLLSDSARLKGCTVINGDLEIEMRNAQGSVNIAQVLSEDLQSVEEVNGYVVVRQSSSLVSLNFFKNLKKIDPGPGTRSAFSERYALAIFDNPNLESLWDFDPNFRILNHGVFVQLNPRLCPQSIYPMFDDILGWNRSDPGENRITVSRTTNGNARQCNVQLISINVTGIQNKLCKDLCVEVSWPITIKDYRDLLLYSIWYRETTNRDLNEYDGVDACNSNNVWKRHDVYNTKGKSRERIGGLNAFTLYAFRLEGFVIANTGVKSSIAYFKTKQTKPSRPLGLDVSFLSASSLQVKWKKPFYPNGDITHYEVRYKQSYSTYRWNKNVDWCKNQGFTTLPSTGDENDNEGKPTVSTCSPNITCECDKDKPIRLGPELKAALFSKEFQDEILSSVFQKIDTDDDDTKITTRATLSTTPGRPLCTNDSKNSSCTGSSSSATEPSAGPTTASSTGNSSLPPTELQENTTSESIVLNGLMYFTEYSVEVCACNSGAGCGTNKGFLRQCSEAVGRTQKSDTADDVGDTLTVWVNNKTRKFSLAWNAPVRPNGIVLRYDVWIQNGNETKPEVVCVLSSTTEYSRSSASLGQYTARVRAITPAGNGSWSNDVVFVIAKAIGTPAPVKKSEDVKLATIVGISLTTLVVLIILFAVAFYRRIRKRYKQKEEDAGVIYASVNPEYLNCSDVYVPDEWEVARDKIKITRELGNGSFGMVYEGEAKDILPGQESCMVAVKTVSDNCSIRDKVDFLKEASIMKAFNCNHVVRLLGVVSAGHPVLVVMELMENGDLKSFLRRRRPSSSEETPNSLPPPTDHELYQMAAEIADGMAYLSDRKFVHRDLAARNCMVSSSCTCKIGDFGMARDVYETDYYRKGGKGFLPVRWMAPESLKDGVFTSASDVWSFGVVLWEMATLAEQPYQGKSNEEVMKVVTDGHRMDAPEACPEVLAHLMMQCWQFKPKLRPSFVTVVCSLAQYTSKEFAERSFYFNQRGRQETSSSCQTTLTEKEDLGDLPKDSKENSAVDNDPQESVV